ncbi:MAG: TIGR02556 family CRISPR-associated protein [Elusimicrobiota bacterium]|nr:TIGR02556 family CRISPR-associated protein [Endomicrobiia bacterium]MDW8166467.1 TIGR02556 family CRISPR-associated protein [Elusimicrobiota bacterium]
MIESFSKIGKEILKNIEDINELVSFLTLEISKGKEDKKQYIVILNIRKTEREKYSLDLDCKEVSYDTTRKYLWLGNPPAANSEQDRLTTNNLEYLVSQVIPNLIKNLPEESELKNILTELRKNIFFDLGEKNEVGSSEAQYGRYRYIWDLSKLGIDLNPESIIKDIRHEPSNNKAKKAVKIVAEKILEEINKKLKLKKEEISLFTLSFNDNILSNHPDYKKYIYEKMISEVFENYEQGVCHLCGEYKNVTWDTTKFWFKFYMTDKLGFSSNLRGGNNFLKNYSICKDCYESVMIAESFIKNNLKTSFAGFNIYILPSFHLLSLLPVKKIENWTEYFKDKFTAVASLDGFHRFQSKLEEYLIYQNIQDSFTLNFLFAEKIQAAFKIFQLLQDVPPSRLDIIIEKAKNVQDLGKKILKADNWYLSLVRIYYILPTGKDRIKNKFILSFFYNLFNFLPFYYKNLIDAFLDRIHEIRFSKDFRDDTFSQTILLQNFLLYFLDELKLIIRGENMSKNQEFLDNLPLNQQVKDFLREAKYSEKMTSLFLLGMLMGDIGTEQFKKGDTKKSILNKINFQGMDLNKITRLFNEIYEKMRQYRVLSSENEKIYGLAKNLFERHKLNWDLTLQENVFYVMSGYSFTTYRAIISGKQKEIILKSEEERNE